MTAIDMAVGCIQCKLVCFSGVAGLAVQKHGWPCGVLD